MCLLAEGSETALAVHVGQTKITLEGGTGTASLPVGLPAFQAAVAAERRSPAARADSPAEGQLQPQQLLPPPQGSNPEGPRPFLGWQASAAAAEECWLPGVGPLLPAWREVASILAPVFHPVRIPPQSVPVPLPRNFNLTVRVLMMHCCDQGFMHITDDRRCSG